MERGLARRRMSHRIAVVASALGLLAACTQPAPFGTANEIAVATSTELWDALEREIVAALEPRTFTVRDEQIFDVVYVQPADTAWTRLRRMRQVLLIGSPREPLIAEALAGRDWEEIALPVVIQLPDVWAEPQIVTVALLPEGAGPQMLEPLLPRIREMYLRQYEDHIRIGMAVTPRNELLSEHLRQVGGFTLALPGSYEFRRTESGVFVFRHEDRGPTI